MSFGSESAPRFDVTIAGEINLDLILYGLPEHLPLDRELLASGFQATLGSSSAILAHNLATLGTHVGFTTLLGRDAFGRMALERLESAGVDLSRVQFSDTQTGMTLLLHHAEGRRILTYPGAMAELALHHLDLDYLASSRHFHLSSLFLHKSLQADLPGLFDELRRRGLTLSLDTNDDPEDAWAGVLDAMLDRIDVLLPNEDELRRIARKPALDEALEVLSKRVPLIVVKLGAQGALVQQGARRELVSPVAVVPVDTIGAGDSFNAGFLSAYVRGKSPVEAARCAVATGALSTLRAGGIDAFADVEFRNTFLERHGIGLGSQG
jgi:sugar/nucleoside kinase (ribokinase family)